MVGKRRVWEGETPPTGVNPITSNHQGHSVIVFLEFSKAIFLIIVGGGSPISFKEI